MKNTILHIKKSSNFVYLSLFRVGCYQNIKHFTILIFPEDFKQLLFGWYLSCMFLSVSAVS